MTVVENAAQIAELQAQISQAGLAFLRAELDVSLTFANLALEATNDSERRRRSQANARKGYDTFMHFVERFPIAELAPRDQDYVREKLERLRSVLKRLGEEL